MDRAIDVLIDVIDKVWELIASLDLTDGVVDVGSFFAQVSPKSGHLLCRLLLWYCEC